MTLPNEHLPLPCSLRDLVNSNFPHEEPGADATVLDTDALAARVRAACEEGDSLSCALASWVECWVEVKSIWPRCSVAATIRQWRSTGSSSTPQPSIVASASLVSRHAAS